MANIKYFNVSNNMVIEVHRLKDHFFKEVCFNRFNLYS